MGRASFFIPYFNSPSFWVAFFWSGAGLFFFFFFFLQDFTFRNRFFFLCFFFLFFEDFSQWDFYIGAGGRCTKCKVLQYLGWGDHGRGGVLLSENLGIGGGACGWRGMHAGDRRGGILRQVKFGSGGGKRVCSFLPTLSCVRIGLLL